MDEIKSIRDKAELISEHLIRLRRLLHSLSGAQSDLESLREIEGEFTNNDLLPPVVPPLCLVGTTDVSLTLGGLFQRTTKDFIALAAENGIAMEEEEFALSE